MSWGLEFWREALPGAQFQGNVSALAEVEGFFIDTRKPSPHGAFVPLGGENVDGHRYVAAALRAETRASFCALSEWSTVESELVGIPDWVVVVVPDVLEAFSRFAAAHLDSFPGTIRLGVTGSNGKTTTKEMLAAALSVFGRTYWTQGNFNSEIGVPLTAVAMGQGFRFAVFEMGINHRGEMDSLASVVRPLVSIITNVGTAHIGMIGSQNDIALEKKKIYSQSGAVAVAVLPGDDRFLPVLTEGFEGRVWLFGRRRPGFRLVANHGLAGTEFEWKGTVFRLKLPGLHQIDNALAVLTAVEALGLDPKLCAPALASVGAEFGRGQVLSGEVTLLLDCYNANFDSMMGLLSVVRDLPSDERVVLVLGSMKELGLETEERHRRLGLEVARLSVDAVFFFGSEAEVAYHAAVDGRFGGHLGWTDDFDNLQSMVSDFVKPGDLVVLKGSRSNRLERLQSLWNVPVEAGRVL